MAAGIILVREAGGFVSDTAGGEDMLRTGNIVAGNGAIHEQLVGLTRAAGEPAHR